MHASHLENLSHDLYEVQASGLAKPFQCPPCTYLLVDDRVSDDSCDHTTYFHCSLTLFSASLYSQKEFLVLIRGLCTTSRYTHSILLCEVVSRLFWVKVHNHALNFKSGNYMIPYDILNKVQLSAHLPWCGFI